MDSEEPKSVRTGSWQSVLPGTIAAVAGIATAVLLVAAAVGSTVTRTDLFVATLEDSAVYRLALPPIAAEIEDSDLAERINVGPFELTRVDIHQVLVQEYEPEDFLLKTREVHAGLRDYLAAYPRDTVFEISIRQHRPALARAGMIRVLSRYQRLPDCDGLEDLEVLARAGLSELFGGSDREFVEELPDCEPPDVVGEPVASGIQEEFRNMIVEGPDSVEAFPDEDDVEMDAYSARIDRIRTLTGVFGWPPWLPLLGVGLLNGILALGSRRSSVFPEGWVLLLAASLGLVALALILLRDGLPMEILEAFGGDRASLEQEGQMWLSLGEYAVASVLEAVGRAALLMGGVAGVGAIAGLAVRYIDATASEASAPHSGSKLA